MGRFSSISLKLFIICLVFVSIIVTAISQLAYHYIRNEMRSNNEYYVKQLLSKVNQNLQLSSASVQSLLYSINSSYNSSKGLVEELKPELTQLLELNQGLIKNIYVIKPDLSIIGGSLLSVVFEEPREERRAIYEQVLKNRVGVTNTKPYASSSSGWTVTIAKYLQGSSPPAVLALDMDLAYFDSSLLDLSQTDLLNIAIIDETGLVVAGVPQGVWQLDLELHRMQIGNVSSQEIAESTESVLRAIDGKRKPVSILKIPASRFNWSILSINDETRLNKPLRQLELYYIGFLILGFFLSVAVAYAVSRFIRRPLGLLRTKMNLIKQGRLDISVSLERKDEFGEFSRTLDLMVRRIADLLEDREEANELKRRLEIQVLQSQINPHFLYNTLGSIGNVIGLGYYDKVDPIIRSLINILEYGIADAAEKVTLEDEMRNVQDYILIQNIRYNKQFKIVEMIDPTLYDFPVFRMLLQPIVENSLFHGYNGGLLDGDIRVSAFRENGLTIIQVEDQGVGISAEKTAGLLLTGEKRSGSRMRIGLQNIHQRIQLYFGKPYGLRVLSEQGKGTCIRAEFPPDLAKGEESA